LSDTICALATTFGEAAIHIVRLSGPAAGQIIGRCFEPANPQRWAQSSNFTLHLGTFRDADRAIDQVLVGKMLSPSSYTGEDVFEINCHGGPLVARRILEACQRCGARLAEPGEFTKRAFLNGKLDLVQAEAIIDLVSARTDSAAQLALAQLSGGMSVEIEHLREMVLETTAFLEAGIDFPEDEVEEIDLKVLAGKLQGCIRMTEEILAGSRTGKILRDGLQTVIAGRPNVGKSSLLNALVREERAIVTEVPGTTRDEIRETVNIGGILLQLVDTAGIRESDDPVERLGIERSWRALDQADLVLLVVQANIPLGTEEMKIIETYGEKVVVLANKMDLLPPGEEVIRFAEANVWIPFSVVAHRGFGELEAEIKRRVYQGEARPVERLLSNVRQIGALERCCQSLRQAMGSLDAGLPWDIVTVDVRQALQAVSEVTGHDVQETLLEDIFSRFCIGK